jgi:hypothetical protein
MGAMASIPIENKVDIEKRLRDHAARWPEIETVTVRFRGQYAYIAAILTGDGAVQPLCRLHYEGDDDEYGFALWRSSHEDYDPTWIPEGTPEAALDLAATLYARN